MIEPTNKPQTQNTVKIMHVKELDSVAAFHQFAALQRASGVNMSKFTAKWTYKDLNSPTEQRLVKEFYESMKLPESTAFISPFCDQFGLFDDRQVYAPYCALNRQGQFCLVVGFTEIPIAVNPDGSLWLNGDVNHELDTNKTKAKDRDGNEYPVLTLIWYSPTYTNHSANSDDPLEVNDYTLEFPVWLSNKPEHTNAASQFSTLIGKKNKGKDTLKFLPEAVKTASTGSGNMVNLNMLLLPVFESGKFTPCDFTIHGWELKPRNNFTSIELYPDLTQLIERFGDYEVQGVFGVCKLSEVTKVTLTSSSKHGKIFLTDPVQPATVSIYAPNQYGLDKMPSFGVVTAAIKAQADMVLNGRSSAALKPSTPSLNPTPKQSPLQTVEAFAAPTAEDLGSVPTAADLMGGDNMP